MVSPIFCNSSSRFKGNFCVCRSGFRQFEVERLNQFVDLGQALIENVQRLAPFVLRVMPIDAAAAPRLHHPLVSAAHGLPRDLGLGANLRLEFHEVRAEALLFDQLLERIRVQMREWLTLAAQVVELAVLLRLLNLVFDVEGGHTANPSRPRRFSHIHDRGIQDPHVLRRFLCDNREKPPRS